MAELANTIFNKLLVKMLSKYLAYYMNNFSKESFKLEVIKGTFTLRDIEINCQFLKDTVVLPNLEITECLCDKIFLTVPWGHITTEPIVFDLDKIKMTLTEIPIGAKTDTKPKKVKPSSYGWMQRTVDGIRMNIKEIDMTANLNGYRGNPFVGKINCKGISIYSTDAHWKPVDLKEAFVADKNKAEVVFFKVLDCQSLTVSFAEASASDGQLEFCTMMRDASVQIRCKVLKDVKDGHVICGEFYLVMEDCELSYSDSQWKGFLEMAKGLVGCFTRTDQEYVHYRDVGKTEEDLRKGAREKIAAEKSKSWWERRKQAKEQEKMEQEKAKRIYEMELRAKERKELQSVGADTSHLDVMEETTFNIMISRGVLNMLNEEERLTDEPGKHAFGRLFFEDMRIVIALPPAMDVPDTNKWTANTNSRLLLDASLQLGNLALQIQEPCPPDEGEGEEGEERQRKQLVLLTDGRSESLKKRVRKERQRKKRAHSRSQEQSSSNASEGADEAQHRQRKAEKQKAKHEKDKQEKKKQRPFCNVTWSVRSHNAEETDMADWLKSLECKMAINVYQSHLVLLHRWWARIIRYLETSSVGSDEVQAMSLMRVVATLNVVDNVMTLPLYGCDKLEVISQQELEALPQLTLYCTKVLGGKDVLGALSARLASVRLPARFSAPKAKGKGKETATGGDPSPRPQKQILHVRQMGDGDDGWLSQQLMRKPQRFQFLLNNLLLSIGKDQILSPIDFALELTLHRYLTTEQLLLELCAHAEALQLHVNRAQYLFFSHFLNYLSSAIWPELEMVLLRKYGPSHIQRSLNDYSYPELVQKLGYMPMTVNSHAMIDYLLLHINGNDLPDEVVNSFFHLDAAGRDDSVLEMHFEDLHTRSTNAAIVTTGLLYKRASVKKVSFYVPPGRPIQNHQPSPALDAPSTSGSSSTDPPMLKVETLYGDVLSANFGDLVSLLTKTNAKAFHKLMGRDDEEKTNEHPDHDAIVRVGSVALLVDDKLTVQVPVEVSAFLKDFATLNNCC